MPIKLITGTPGAGKTLLAIKTLIEEIIPLGRPIYCNIEGLNIDAENLHICNKGTPHYWQDYDSETGEPFYPDGSFFIFDEVQEQYPPRNGAKAVPLWISKYETHRHRGFDFLFITQGPRLIDRHLHDLIDGHKDLYRPFGLKRSTVSEWASINVNPRPSQTRTNALVNNFSFPAKYFEYYKSATVHTVKPNYPWRLIFTILFIVCFAAFMVFGIFKYLIGFDPTDNYEIAAAVETECDLYLIGSDDINLYLVDPLNLEYSIPILKVIWSGSQTTIEGLDVVICEV